MDSGSEYTVFDLPDGTKPMGHRPTNATPPAALYLMNNRMVVEQSRHFAEKLLKEAPTADAGRIRWAFRRALQRNPTPQETARVIELVKQLENGQNSSGEKTVWATIAQALLNTNEFSYLD